MKSKRTMIKGKAKCYNCNFELEQNDAKIQTISYAHAHSKRHHVYIIVEKRIDYPFDLTEKQAESLGIETKTKEEMK